MNRRVVLLVSLGFTSAVVAAPPDAATVRHAATAQGFCNMIAGLRDADDAPGFRRLGDEIKREWRAPNSPAYYRAVLDVCLGMNSTRNTDPGIDKVIRELALAVLDAPGDKPADVTSRLVLFLHGDLDYSTGKLSGEVWAAARKAHAERWVRVWRSVRDQNAALPYPTELPLMRVPRPGGIIEGRDGPPIKDPVKRKEHEEAVERNNRLHEAHWAKRNLQDLEEDIEGDATRYLTDAYSRPPFRTDELPALLVGLGSAKDRKAIVAEVKRREEAEGERAAAVAKARAAAGPGVAGRGIQYSYDGTTFRDAPLPLYVEKGTPITFRAAFAGEGCAWGGTAGVRGAGVETAAKLATLSKHAADFRTVTVAGNGGTATAHVVVYELHPIYTPKDDFPGRDYDAFGVYEFINLSYKTVPPGIRDVDLGGLRWVIQSGGGDLYGGGGGVGTYQVGGAAGRFALDLQVLGRRKPGQ